MLPRLRHKCSSLPCFVTACLMTIGGGLLASFWPAISSHIMQSVLLLKPGGIRFEAWKDTPIPIYVDFYFFNWTNPDELLVEGKKPAFQEMGPYRFLEKKQKTDIVWNDNGTLSFKIRRRWYFDPENSNGSLSDNITTINVLSLSAAYVLRDWNPFLLLPVNQILKTQPLVITHNVSEFLFEGFDDPLIRLSKLGSVFASAIKMPYDKFGWFYSRNDTTTTDGIFNMATGAGDFSRVGDVLEWNQQNCTTFYPGACGQVSGSTGEVFPMDLKKDYLKIYSSDLCRPILFEYQREVSVVGVRAYEYAASLSNIDNGTLDPSNECYCGGECIPSGLVNVSACKFGAPTFISYPHFYQADPYYLDLVEGMMPLKEKHSFGVKVEPKTGAPLELLGRLQVNLLVKPYKSLSVFADLPRVFFPLFWFEQRARVTPELATALQLLLLLAPVGLAATYLFFGLGLAVCSVVLVMFFCRRQEEAKKSSLMMETASPLMTDDKGLPLTTTYSVGGAKRSAKKTKGEICLIREDSARPVIVKT